jgi:histidinol-phosphate aminotransferase
MKIIIGPDSSLRDSAEPVFPAPRPEVDAMTSAVHGSIDFAELQELGLSPDNILDFSSNINPYAPSDAVRAAVASTRFDRYPDRSCGELRRALADSLRLSPNRLLAGNGVAELIWLTALAHLEAGSRVLVLGPTFCEYARAAELMGATLATLQAGEETGFRLEQAHVAERLGSFQPQVVFICNPNNPTGTTLPVQWVAIWARRCPRTLFVIDEAYHPFAPGVESALDLELRNVLTFRSMTKDFGLAGLRLGFAVGDPNIIESLRQAQPPWSVNSLAQAAGVAALHNLASLRRSLELLAAVKRDFMVGLVRRGLTPLPSATPFFLVRVGDGTAFRQKLLRRGILVRACDSFGLPAYVRIATRRPEENERLLTIVGEEA